MNIFAICASENDNVFKNYLFQSCNRIGIPCINVKDDPKATIPCTLEQKYNAGVTSLLQQTQLQDNDVIIFAKETVNFIDSEIKEKIQMCFEFEQYKDVAILGMCGISTLEQKPFFMNESVGQLMIPSQGDANCGDVLEFQKVGFFTDVLTVYDNCFAIKVKYLKLNYIFDDKNFKNSPFYLLDLCVRLKKDGYKIGISQILIFDACKDIFKDPPPNHIFNVNNYNQFESIFLEKHGLKFPINSNSLQTESVLINISDL